MKLVLLGMSTFALLAGMGTSAFCQAANERDLTRRMQDMRGLEPYSKQRSEKDRRERERALEAMNSPEMDSATKERRRQMLMLHTPDVERYKDFLTDKKTGIFRIFPDFDCVSRNVVKVGSECRAFVPDTSDFSFRSTAYMIRLYHDIGFNRNELISKSFFAQGILVSLGDAPIGKIDLATGGLKYLRDFKPDTFVDEAKMTARRIERGLDFDGFHYGNSVLPSENTTYGLRTVAYRYAGYLPAITPASTMDEIKFKGLEGDTRDDVILAFRIVRKDADGGLTIVWRELMRQRAPELKFAKGEALKDFKIMNDFR